MEYVENAMNQAQVGIGANHAKKILIIGPVKTKIFDELVQGSQLNAVHCKKCLE